MINQRWRLVIILGFSTVLSLSGDLTLYATLPVNAEVIGLTLGQVGILLSANRFIRILSNPLTGILLDLGRRRPIYIYGLVLGTLSTLIYVLSQQFLVLLFGRLIWGIAWSFIHVGGNTMIVDCTERIDRGRFLGILKLFMSIGLSINPLLGAFLSDTAGFQPSLLICAILTGLGLLLAILLLPETRRLKNLDIAEITINQNPLIKIQGESKRTHPLKTGFRKIILSWETITATFLYMIIYFAGNGLVMSTIGLFLKAEFGNEVNIANQISWGIATLSGFLLAYRAFIVAIVAPFAGGLSDRYNSRWSTIIGGILIGAFGMVSIGLSRDIFSVFIGVSLTSIGEGILVTVLPAVVGDISTKDSRGKAIGKIFVAGDIGSAVAPMLSYSMLAVLSLKSIYLFSALCLGIGLFSIIVMSALAKSKWAHSKPERELP